MIDEELYKRATEELDSDARKPDVWTRACALASDDHDEARFLYTNLRVEEMLSKDGRQRTFSPNRHRRGTVLSDPEKLELPELETEGAESDFSASSPQSNTAPAFALDSEADADIPVLDANKLDEFKLDDLNIESDGEIMPLDTPVKATPETATGISKTDLSLPSDLNKEALVANKPRANDIVSDIPSAAATANQRQALTPEQQKTSALTQKLEQQAQSLHVDGQQSAQLDSTDTTGLVVNDISAPGTTAVPQPTTPIRDDYVAPENRLEQPGDKALDTTSAPLEGGPVFNVLERNGTVTAIKKGVSWPGLLCTFPWLLSKAMLGTAIVYGLLWLVSLVGLYVTGISWLDAGPEASISVKLWTVAFAALAVIGLLYIPFRYGNAWVEEKLKNRGYKLAASVNAGNKRDAVKRVVEQA